ncbi:MAG: hypothetical protein AABY32_04050 [Nanoarchaeota archaeon]
MEEKSIEDMLSELGVKFDSSKNRNVITVDDVLADKQFDKHEAIYSKLTPDNSVFIPEKYKDRNVFEALKWKNPESSIYSIMYLHYFGHLFVSGDLGEAVYQWSENATLEWISTLPISYFASKCQASEEGRGYKIWDAETAKEHIIDYLENDDYDEDKNKKQVLSNIVDDNIFYHLDSERVWCSWLDEYGDDYFGSDCWEYGDIGMVTAPRCVMHLAGLKAAFSWLENNKK